MKRNMNDWSRAIQLFPKVAMPIMTYRFGVDGKSVKEVVTDGQSQFEVMKCLAENFPSAAAVTIMDLLWKPKLLESGGFPRR